MEQNIDNFKLWSKWFWVGIAIVMTSMSVIAGLVYGIALAVEKEHRKEGTIIIIFALVWFIFVTYFLIPYLIQAGIISHYQLLKVR